MASRRATTTLTKSALTLASLNATKSSRIPLSRSRAIAVATSARTFGSSADPFSRPSFVPEGRNVASAKYLASAFSRSFHSTTPNFSSATSSSQANQNEFTEMAWEGIVGAVDAARNSKQQVVESEHLMKALLEQKDGLARRIFTKAGLDNTTVLQATDDFIDKQPKVTGGTSGPIMGSHLVGLLDNARRQKKDMKDDFVSVEHLVLAFQADARFGQQLFRNLQLSDKDLKEAVKDVRGNQRVTDQNPEGKYEALDKYGNDLTELARRGKLDPVIGRDDEIRRCIQILSRRTKNNPVIIGEPGVGKTAIAEGLKQRKIDLHYTEEAVELLGTLGFDPNFGARPVKRVIQQLVENEIAMGVLRGDFNEEDSLIVDAEASPSAKDLPPQKRLRIEKLESTSAADAIVVND